MPELIAHLFGDYIFQNHWMALNKTKSSVACLIHVILYTIPFLFLTRSPVALVIISGTHFIIDRWSLAKRWPAFWGVGCKGWVMSVLRYESPLESAPPFLAVWLTIIVDNTIHLTINHFALAIT
jgi:hypothetical protein